MIAYRLDIKEADKSYTITAEVPGYATDDINIEVKDDTLIISSEAQEEKEEQDEGYIIQERTQRSFSRLIKVPQGTNAEDIAANLDKGLLTITIPKKAPAPPKRVEISEKSLEEKVDVK